MPIDLVAVSVADFLVKDLEYKQASTRSKQHRQRQRLLQDTALAAAQL